MAPARIFLSTLVASTAAIHGGPIVARRHAAAISRQGAHVLLAAPSGEAENAGPFEVQIYEARNDRFAAHQPDNLAQSALRNLAKRFRPDAFYDIHGPAYAVEVAKELGVPVVSMVGDYMWYCLQSFLVDSTLKRCSGPESADKCFECLGRHYPPRWRALHRLLKPAADRGLASFPLHDGVMRSREYRARMRDQVDAFVIGDEQARDFFAAHGVAPHKIRHIPQGLPPESLMKRPRPDSEPNRPLRFGFVGRPHVEKGIGTLAAAFDSLGEDVSAELWIIHSHYATPDGLRARFPSAERFDRALHSGRIKLIRPTSHSDVLSLMAQIDIGVVPSIAYESPSLALLEFVAQGTPVVRSESRGMQHVIQDGVNGRTFPYGNATALSAILRQIVAEPAIVKHWQRQLPQITSDDEYARKLLPILMKDELVLEHS